MTGSTNRMRNGGMDALFERRAALKAALRSREPLFAAWTSFGHPQITEIFANGPFAFIGIDIEHSTISLDESRNIIAAAQAGGMLCLPRIASHNPEMIKRLLDQGADGLLVPMVETVEQAGMLVDCIKYPPAGKRSFGIARGQNYGFNFDDYTAKWNDTGSLILQIESIKGVDNIEGILALDGVDGVMVGPYDMSGSLGVPGQIDGPEVREAGQRVIQAAKAAGKACGTQIIEPGADAIAAAYDQGYSFAVLSSDIFALWKWTEGALADVEDWRSRT